MTAPNAVRHPVVDYAPDPRGWGMVAALARRINASTNGPRPVVDLAPTFYGAVPGVQSFRGAANSGTHLVAAAIAPTINEQIAANTSASAAVFYGRMARGK